MKEEMRLIVRRLQDRTTELEARSRKLESQPRGRVEPMPMNETTPQNGCFRHQLLVGSRKVNRLKYVTAESGVTNSGWLQIGNKCLCQIEIRTNQQQ
jgi:hypothetical protein